MKRKIGFSLPCYNEEANIPVLYKRITAQTDQFPMYDFEFLFCDNASTDKTQQVIEDLARKDKRVKLIVARRNFGPNRNSHYALFHSSGDAVIAMATDLQDPPELISKFISLWESGSLIVMAQTQSLQDNVFLRFFRRLFYRLMNSFSDTEQFKGTTGFGLYDRSVVQELADCYDQFTLMRNIIADLGFQVSFVPFDKPARENGKSSYNFFRYYEQAITSIVGTSRLPLRFATWTGFFIAVVSFVIALYYFVYKLIHWSNFSAGNAPLVVGLFFLGAVQLIFIGVLGEYIGIIFARLRKPPMFSIRRTINLDNEKENERGEK